MKELLVSVLFFAAGVIGSVVGSGSVRRILSGIFRNPRTTTVLIRKQDSPVESVVTQARTAEAAIVEALTMLERDGTNTGGDRMSGRKAS